MATAVPASGLAVLVVAAGIGLAVGLAVAVRTGGGQVVRGPRAARPDSAGAAVPAAACRRRAVAFLRRCPSPVASPRAVREADAVGPASRIC